MNFSQYGLTIWQSIYKKGCSEVRKSAKFFENKTKIFWSVLALDSLLESVTNGRSLKIFEDLMELKCAYFSTLCAHRKLFCGQVTNSVLKRIWFGRQRLKFPQINLQPEKETLFWLPWYSNFYKSFLILYLLKSLLITLLSHYQCPYYLFNYFNWIFPATRGHLTELIRFPFVTMTHIYTHTHTHTHTSVSYGLLVVFLKPITSKWGKEEYSTFPISHILHINKHGDFLPCRGLKKKTILGVGD